MWMAAIAVVVGFCPLAIAEVACRLFAWGEADEFEMQLERIRPLFEVDSTGERMETAEYRLGYFVRDSFVRDKQPSGRRIFCIGGSTVQGRPYSIETAFSAWLKIGLEHLEPETEWEVVNCGGVSYASYRLVPVVAEALRYSPDAIVLMTGHNEFLEERTLSSSPPAHDVLRTPALLGSLFRRGKPLVGREILPEEVDALLDYQGGLETYQLDFEWRKRVVRQYRKCLDEIVEMCALHDVPLILVEPVDNLRDTPPFKVAHSPELSEFQLQQWQQYSDAAEAALRDDSPDLNEAVYWYERAAEVDAWHAGTWYQLARCFDAQRDYTAAKAAYTAARDSDVCPLRMTTELHRELTAVAETARIPLVLLVDEINSRSQDGIRDSQWLLDHVHPTIVGHQLIASMLLDELAGINLVAESSTEQQDAIDNLWALHLQKMPTSYFTTGSKRLSALNRWAQGRGDKLRPATTSADRSR